MLDMKENRAESKADYRTVTKEVERAMLDAWEVRDKETWLAWIAGVGAFFTIFPRRIYVAGGHALVTTENLSLPSREGNYVYGMQPYTLVNLEVKVDTLDYYRKGGSERRCLQCLEAWWDAGDVAASYAPNIDMLSENFYSSAALLLREHGRRANGVDELDFTEVTVAI